MKFSEMAYRRPDMQAAAEALTALAAAAAGAESGARLLRVYDDYRRLADEIGTARAIASVRHTVDTRDAFYSAENDYFDRQGPVVDDKVLGVYRALLASPHRAALAEKHGEILLERLAVSVKGGDERLVGLRQQENALETRYEQWYASAKIPFGGKELTVAQLAPYKQHTHRATRRAAFEAEGAFFDGNREELDEIYQKMVENRTEQAQMLGHGSFTPLGDIRMERLGYTRGEIRACREAVAKEMVPVVRRLKRRQAGRIAVADFKFYDDALSFADGNPVPRGTPQEILEAGRTMYRALSPQTAEFIEFMMEGELFDVLAKPGKAPGGYCTYIPACKSPFIFSNFSGTFGDVDVLTHEAGHAFASYLAARRGLPGELRSPGLESCEIHSMSMEFLTREYHHLFFGRDTEKYAISHAEDTLAFLPYGCQVDEFQETVYDNPRLSPRQRHALWLELEKKYRPWNDFDALPFYSRGAGWQRQLHIYTAPFYYIDYVLAQAVALQFFLAHLRDAPAAWRRYLALAEKGGAESYVGLVRAAGLQTPFEEGVMQRVGGEVAAWIAARPGA